jgi:hypothetical protein
VAVRIRKKLKDLIDVPAPSQGKVLGWGAAGAVLNLSLSDLGGTIRGQATNGATAVAVKFGNANALSTAGAKIASFYSDDLITEKAYFDKDGNLGVGAGNAGSITAGTLYANNLSATGAQLNIYGSPADAPGVIAIKVDTFVNYTASSAKLVSFRNNAVEKASIDKDGVITAGSGAWMAGNLSPGAGYAYLGPSGEVAKVRGSMADGATAVGVALDSINSLTVSGAKIASFRTAGVEKSYVDKDGNFYSGTSRLATEKYTQSRGMNLVSNGTGLMGTNYNFSTYFTFTGVEAYGSSGSFANSTLSAVAYNDEFIPVDPGKYYDLRLWAKAVTAAPVNHAYFGGAFYDVDGNNIQPYCHMFLANTHTTLAAPLKVGDTTITLTSATNWYSGATNYQRQIIIWGYKNSLGYKYPDYTYSRWTTNANATYTTPGAWAQGGISGNVITLTAPWPSALNNPDDPTNGWPIGTPVSNNNSGGSFKYFAASNVVLNPTWTEYRGSIGGLDLTGTNVTNSFPPGSASMKILFLLNRDTTSIACTSYVTNIWFSEMNPLTMLNAAGDATASATLLNSQSLTMRARYWDGAKSVDYDAVLRHEPSATTPASKLSFKINGSEVAYLNNGGLFYAPFVYGTGFYGSAAGPALLSGTQVDGASSVGTILNSPAFSTTGSKVTSIRNNSVEKAYFDKDGGLFVTGVPAGTNSAVTIPTNTRLMFGSGNNYVYSNGAGLYFGAAVYSTGFYANGSTVLPITGLPTEGSTAVGVSIRSYTPLVTAGAKIVSFQNSVTSNGNYQEKAYVDKDGIYSGLAFYSTIGVLGTISADTAVQLRGNRSDGANSTAVRIQSAQTLSTAGAKIASFENPSSVVKAFVDKDGNFTAPTYYTNAGAMMGPSTLGQGVHQNATNTALALGGRIDDGAAAIAIKFGNLTSLTTTGAKIASFYSDAGSTERAYIGKDGEYVNKVPLWDDVQGPVTQAGGISALTFEAYRDTGFFTYFMRHNQDDTIYLTYQMPHSWDPSTSVRPHMHVIPMADPASTEVVRVTGKYAWAQVGVELPADASWTSFTVDTNIATGDVHKKKIISLAVIAPPSNPKESNVLCLWVKRPGLSDAADTYSTGKGSGTAAANLCILSVDTHFQKQKLGSLTEIP